jgi:hypothetical protein
MDVLTVSVAELLNPQLIPANKLGPQTIHGIVLPGLSVLAPADFQTILSQDPFVSVAPTTAAPPFDCKVPTSPDRAL